jgi:hypothetical protein
MLADTENVCLSGKTRIDARLPNSDIVDAHEPRRPNQDAMLRERGRWNVEGFSRYTGSDQHDWEKGGSTRPERLLSPSPMFDLQARSHAGLELRRQAMKPMPAKPRSIIAQVDGSGTPPAIPLPKPSLSAMEYCGSVILNVGSRVAYTDSPLLLGPDACAAILVFKITS